MLVHIALTALLAVAQAQPSSYPSYHCHDFALDIKVDNITVAAPSLTSIKDEYEATYLADRFIQRNAVVAAPSMTTLTKTFKITGKWCAPPQKGDKSSTLQILSHGIGFDQSYWDFYLPGSHDAEYSYINSATKAGYTTLSYNRLGIYPSTIGDPFFDVQPLVELDILRSLTILARDGKIPGLAKPKHVVQVGHSYGSELVVGLSATAPELSDAVVITGLSEDVTYAPYFVSATSFHIASQNQPKRFKNWSNGYLTWGSSKENQFAFFAYPNFDPRVLEHAEATKFPFSYAQFTTMALLPFQAPKFKNPVLVVASQYDLIACGFNCDGLYDKDGAIIQAFNGSRSVQTFSQTGAGHGLNLHKNATGAYEVINSWIETSL